MQIKIFWKTVKYTTYILHLNNLLFEHKKIAYIKCNKILNDTKFPFPNHHKMLLRWYFTDFELKKISI